MSSNQDDRTSSGRGETPNADAAGEPAATTPVAGSFKDRIADLRVGQRAGALGGRLADRMKAVQAAAPAAAQLKDKMIAAAGAVRLDKLNREGLKAGRDGLAAKVENLLKARPAEEPAPPPPVTAPVDLQRAEEAKPTSRRDIQALKARLDDALKAKAGVAPEDTSSRADTPSMVSPSSQVAPVLPQVETVAQASVATATERSTDNGRAQEPVTAAAAAPPSLTARVRTGFGRLVTKRPAIVADAPAASAVTVASDASDGVTTRTRTLRTERAAAIAAADAERRRPIFSLGLLLTAFTAGGVLHILTAFMIPSINTGSAFDRLYFQLEANTMRVMPAGPGDPTSAKVAWPLPFLTADMRYAVCRYDLSGGSVLVSATLPEVGWSLALYTPQGDNFYAVPGQDGRVVNSTFSINSASDRLLLPVPGVRRSDTDAAQVTSPQREGLVVIRAPNMGPAYQLSQEEALKRASCRAAPRR